MNQLKKIMNVITLAIVLQYSNLPFHCGNKILNHAPLFVTITPSFMICNVFKFVMLKQHITTHFPPVCDVQWVSDYN